MDPAFAAHCGPIVVWATAVWESWLAADVMQKLWAQAFIRLPPCSSQRSPWASVRGPAAAYVATARRLAWHPLSVHLFRTDDGQVLDLRRGPPGLRQAPGGGRCGAMAVAIGVRPHAVDCGPRSAAGGRGARHARGGVAGHGGGAERVDRPVPAAHLAAAGRALAAGQLEPHRSWSAQVGHGGSPMATGTALGGWT